MKRLLAFSIWLLVLGCSSGPSPEQQAAEAAQQYYNRLLEGYPDGFLAGRAGVDSLPADYRRQLVSACEQYVTDMAGAHGGLRAVDISPNVGRRDSTLQLTYAFLLLTFNDSTQEEITVPMVEVDGEWRMR